MDVYIIYSCNEWQAYSSFRFMAVVDKEHLDNILNQIKQDYHYTDKDMETYIYVSKEKLNELQSNPF